MAPDIPVFHKIDDFYRWRNQHSGKSFGLVPTMGALHAGHVELLKHIRPRVSVSILSIFVNPIQFGPSEDFSTYPRTLHTDVQIAAKNGADAVFVPSQDEMYPRNFSTYVEEFSVSKDLCGEFRPTHFRGVCTVVLKLINIVQPSIAVFGLKDAQQFFTIHRMVRDLNLLTSLRIEGMPTIRHDDGLALSSRNVFLSIEQRKIAPVLYRTLKSSSERLLDPQVTPRDILSAGKSHLQAYGFRVQYFKLMTLPDLLPASAPLLDAPYLLAAAAYLGDTRLIDNVILKPDLLKKYDIQMLT